MTSKVFITGSSGLIGRALRAMLEADGISVVGCDLRAADSQQRFDLCDVVAVRHAIKNCDGVIHLGGVSRVIDGERNPKLCARVNVDGTHGIVEAVAESPRRPWLLFASSREVYGQPPRLPCGPETPLNPMNAYARSKAAAERIVFNLRKKGATVAVLRFSNVFGAVDDYPDRVVPAFARAAATGGVMRLEGPDNLFDFTGLEDAATAAQMAVGALQSGIADLPPLDVVTGRATSLYELAAMAMATGSGRTIIAPPRDFDVPRFQGDPAPIAHHLGWRASGRLEEQVARLVNEFRAALRKEKNNAQIL